MIGFVKVRYLTLLLLYRCLFMTWFSCRTGEGRVTLVLGPLDVYSVPMLHHCPSSVHFLPMSLYVAKQVISPTPHSTRRSSILKVEGG